VEGALERTNPGKAFTLGVLAALPALTISARRPPWARRLQGTAAAKAAGVMGCLAQCSPTRWSFLATISAIA